MKKIILFCLLCIPFVSCQSAGRNELTGRNMDMAPVESSGQVETVVLQKGMLSLPERNIIIACLPDTEKVKSLIKRADQYRYSGFSRPDGPVKTLLLEKEGNLTAWIGDGIRSGMGPDGLKILPGKEDSQLVLQSDSDSWIIPSGKETGISWMGESWLVYVSNITMGTLQDQPPFTADILILKQ